MPFGPKLRRLRKERNITQDGLGKLLGMGRTAIANYESGRNQPSNEVLVQISDFFDVSIDYLLGRTSLRPGDTLAFNRAEAEEELPEEARQELNSFLEYLRSKYRLEDKP
ncbi:MAG: helix-turn-helix domain-containing protein [Christensenellales bacterium]|jgi:transcriptional regulator with XRE-family HTH domain